MIYNIHMKTSKTLSVTLPPEMLKRARLMARKESRTMSELVREALRHYERRSWWDEVNTYGQAKAKERGIHEEDVSRVIDEARAEQRAVRR
jgi:CopG family transcriptional regulator / antitoxin EndoAI